MNAHDRTNHRIAVLMACSTIFMPLTMLAGIWGMNFEAMPELKLSFGYPLALGTMACVGSAMYLFFSAREDGSISTEIWLTGGS